MSLFGGHDGRESPSQASDFSISTINDEERNERARSSSYAAQLDGTHDSDPDHDRDNGNEQEQEQVTLSRSPSAISDTSDTDARPNRFRGTDRAWLHYTRDDRQLAQSLDQLRANDLSLHLHSAHGLKAALRNPTRHDFVKPWSRKSRWVPANQQGDKPWYPAQDWTAWPLDPDTVPRGNETFGALHDGLDAFTLEKNTPSRPSYYLQEQLYALLLQRANQTWKSRDLGLEPLAKPEHPQNTVSASNVSTRSVSAGPSLPPSSSIDPHLPPMSSMDQSVMSIYPEDISQQPQETQESINPLPRPLVKSEDIKQDQDEAFARPVFSADDDGSQKILYPTVRHIVSKLDNLLLALHQTREAQFSRLRDAQDTSDSSAKSHSRSRSRSFNPSGRRSTPAPNRQRHRRLRSASRQEETPAEYVIFDDSGEDETYQPTVKPRNRSTSVSSTEPSPKPGDQDLSPSKDKKRRPDTHRLGLRDWSEVLGVAALSGWDPVVIEKTRQRCKGLFGEDMQLHVMPEYGDSSADEADIIKVKASASQKSHTPQTEGWRCPLANCFRNIQPLAQGFRWREHMRDVHKYEKDQVANLEEQLVRSGAIPAGTNKRRTALAHNPRGWQPPDPLKCLHCPTAETIYPRISRLLDHIRRTHKYDPRVDAPPQAILDADAGRNAEASSGESDSGDADSDDYMVGGVHNDGFLQPVLRHAGVRGLDQAQRLKRSNTRRSKVELKNAKKQRVHEPSPPLSQLSDPDNMDVESE